MCNIAGYVGQRRAAPILLEMIRRQEGMAGGYYSGLATIHEGKIYYAKLTGDFDRLVANTVAAELPGNIGIIHTRSKSGGGDPWAHPFIGRRGGEAEMAYVANGMGGCFAVNDQQYVGLADELEAEGYHMDSRTPEERPGYPKMSDGMTAHMSDVMCQLIMREYDGGVCGQAAMEGAFCRMPNEIVGLSLFRREPDRIAWARINMPMSVAFCGHGAYLATSPTAFPADAGAPTLLPACGSGYVTAGSYEARPFDAPPCRVAELTADTVAAAYSAVCRAFEAEEQTVGKLKKAVKPCFEPADCDQSAAAVYSILYALQKQGRLSIESRRVAGAREDLDAPRFYMTLK